MAIVFMFNNMANQFIVQSNNGCKLEIADRAIIFTPHRHPVSDSTKRLVANQTVFIQPFQG